MEEKVFQVSLTKNPIISINLTPGHFTTSNLHTNFYLDVSLLKTNSAIARDVATELAIPYLTSKPVDTIVCMERTEVIGAYLAQALLQEGTGVINSGNIIHVVTPVNNVKGNMTFPDNIVKCIANKNILLLIATVSSGKALSVGIECIEYYGGRLAGVSSLYTASPDSLKYKINSLFTSEDIPGYKLFSPNECALCKAGAKLDAIVSSDGYTIL